MKIIKCYPSIQVRAEREGLSGNCQSESPTMKNVSAIKMSSKIRNQMCRSSIANL